MKTRTDAVRTTVVSRIKMKYRILPLTSDEEINIKFDSENQAWDYIAKYFLCNYCKSIIKYGELRSWEEDGKYCDELHKVHPMDTSCSAEYDVITEEEYNSLINNTENLL